MTLYYTRPWDPRGSLRVPSTAFCHRPGMHTTITHSLAAGLSPQGAVSQPISRECPPVFRDLTATAGGFVGQPETHPTKDFKRQAGGGDSQTGRHWAPSLSMKVSHLLFPTAANLNAREQCQLSNTQRGKP